MDAKDFAALSDGIAVFVDVIAGYKNKLIEAGFGTENAEIAALEMHWALIQKMLDS